MNSYQIHMSSPTNTEQFFLCKFFGVLIIFSFIVCFSLPLFTFPTFFLFCTITKIHFETIKKVFAYVIANGGNNELLTVGRFKTCKLERTGRLLILRGINEKAQLATTELRRATCPVTSQMTAKLTQFSPF